MEQNEMSPENIEKINKLARSLKDTGLASSMSEAVEQAKNIIFGSKKEEMTAKEMAKEVSEVKEDLDSDKPLASFDESQEETESVPEETTQAKAEEAAEEEPAAEEKDEEVVIEPVESESNAEPEESQSIEEIYKEEGIQNINLGVGSEESEGKPAEEILEEAIEESDKKEAQEEEQGEETKVPNTKLPKKPDTSEEEL